MYLIRAWISGLDEYNSLNSTSRNELKRPESKIFPGGEFKVPFASALTEIPSVNQENQPILENMADSASPEFSKNLNTQHFRCEKCGKKYNSAKALRSHIISIHEGKRFQCNLCDKEFTQKSGLQRHKRIHTGIKPFLCEICGKAFNRSEHLKMHRRIHF